MFSFLFSAILAVSIIGTINKKDGIGRQSIELGCALDHHCDVQVVPVGTFSDLNPDELELIHQDYRTLHPIVFVNMALPEIPYIVENLKKYRRDGQIFACYTMIESSLIDPHFAEALNFFDYVVVPDPFLIEVFENSGVKSKMKVIPLGLNLAPFLRVPLKSLPQEVFVFGNYSAAIFRKDQLKLIQAFEKKFKNNAKVKLLIQCRGGDWDCVGVIEAYIKEHGLKNVEFSVQLRSASEYLEMFQKTDCYVSPSLGEGFSIQPREAMALGIPVIVSPNSGQKTIAESGYALFTKTQTLVPATYSDALAFFEMGHMWESDVDELAEQMEDLYLNYGKYFKDGKHRRKWAMQYDFHRGTTTKKFVEFIRELEK